MDVTNKVTVDMETNADGTSNIQIDYDDETLSILIEKGIEDLFHQIETDYPLPDEINEFSDEMKNYVFTDKQLHILLQYGVINIIKDQLNRVSSEDNIE
jgi:hypothetical protein